MYECEGEIYQQADGCPAGLRTSGPISRVCMDYWVKELKNIEQITGELYRNNPVNFDKLTIHLIKKYVNDVLFSGDKFKPGISWDKESKTLVWTEQKSN